MKIIKTQEEFQKQVLDIKDTPVLVDFFAAWCGPCQMMEPVLESLEKNHKEAVIIKVNVDESNELASKYNVMSIPTTFVFKNGNVVKQMVGLQTEASLIEALKS